MSDPFVEQGTTTTAQEEDIAFAPTDDDTIDEAADLIKSKNMSSSGDPPSEQRGGGGDPPAEDPPFTQSVHAVSDYPASSDDEEVIDEEIIEEEILTDGEETIEEEIIEEEVTEGSLRKEEDNIKTMSSIPEEGGGAGGGTPPSPPTPEKVEEPTPSPAAAAPEPVKEAVVPPAEPVIVAPVDAPPSPRASANMGADATASPTRREAPKMDNDLAAFMERRRRAADGEDGSTPTGPMPMDDEKTAHMSNLDDAKKEEESHAESMAEEHHHEPEAVVPPPPPIAESEPPSLFEQQRSYEQQPSPYQQQSAYEHEPEPEPEPQQQDRAVVAGAAVAGAAVGGAAMYYAQQEEEEEEDEDEEGMEDEEEADEPPVAQPVQSFQTFQQQSQQSPYSDSYRQQQSPYSSQQSPYSSQQSPYTSQQSPYTSAAPPPPGDVEDQVVEQPRGSDKAASAPEQARNGPTWGCFALCCILALLLIGAAAVLGVLLSDEDDEPAERVIVIETPPPDGPTPTQPTRAPSPTPPPTFGPLPPIPMELGREISGPVSQGFGAAVAVSSTKLSVGAPLNQTGTVFHYTKMGNFWERLEEVNGPNAQSQFGFSIDMNSVNSMIIGAPEANVQGRQLAVGSAYYYTYQPDTESFEIQGSPIQGGRFAGNVNERFGESVALSSTTLRAAVGAPRHSNGTGRVYMFELTGGEWTPMDDQELLGASAGDLLGSAVDMSEDGTIVAVGSPGNAGLRIYEWLQGEWTATLNERGTANSLMGSSVAVLSNKHVVVGVPGAQGGRGNIRLYEKSLGLWTLAATLVGTGNQAIGGKGLLTGMADPDPQVTFGTATGQVRRFDYVRGEWQERFTINTPFSGLTSVAIDKGSDTVKLWAGSSTAGEVAEYLQVITPAPTRPLTRAPTLQPTVAPTRTLAPTTETKSPTTSPTDPPTQIPAGSGWVMFNGPFTLPGENNAFGTAVAVEGDVMAAGTPRFSGGVGAIQVYRKDGTNWRTMATIYDTDALGFGDAIDMKSTSERTSMIVGAPQTNGVDSNIQFGSVQYLEIVNSQWSAVGSLLRPDATVFSAGGEFGAAVAVSASARRIAVGAPQTNLDADNLRNGRVFTYQYDGNDFVEFAPPLDGFASGDRFGYAVAMTEDGSRLLIGAPGAEGTSTGAIYYYRLNASNQWTRLLPLPGSTAGENLGTSVAILATDGETIAMGAPNYDGGRGVVRVYRNTKPAPNVDFWEQLGGDIIGEAGDLLGTTLSSANGRVVVGTANGGFKVYRLVSNAWTEEDDGPSTGSPVVALAANSEEEVVVGLASQQVAVYGLF